LLCLVANLENRAHNLALHLPVNQNDIFLVINDVSNLRTNFPYLSSQLINDIIE